MKHCCQMFVTACVGLSLMAGCADPLAGPYSVAVEKGICYAERDGARLCLDLYRPKEASAPRPLVVWIHGGGWMGGDRAGPRPLARATTILGYASASIDYRLTRSGAQFPAQVQDVAEALRFLRRNAGRYGIDPERVVVGGDSAGGHLALMVAACHDEGILGGGAYSLAGPDAGAPAGTARGGAGTAMGGGGSATAGARPPSGEGLAVGGSNPDRRAASEPAAGDQTAARTAAGDGPAARDEAADRLSTRFLSRDSAPIRVRGVINIYGPTDLAALQKSGDASVHPLLRAFLGCSPRDNPKRWADASPVTHLSPGDPPILTVHGDWDHIVPFDQARRLDAKCRELGIPHTLVRLPRAVHGWASVQGPTLKRSLPVMAQFLGQAMAEPAAKKF